MLRRQALHTPPGDAARKRRQLQGAPIMEEKAMKQIAKQDWTAQHPPCVGWSQNDARATSPTLQDDTM